MKFSSRTYETILFLLSRFCCFFKINVTIYYFYVSSFTKLSLKILRKYMNMNICSFPMISGYSLALRVNEILLVFNLFFSFGPFTLSCRFTRSVKFIVTYRYLHLCSQSPNLIKIAESPFIFKNYHKLEIILFNRIAAIYR